MRFVRYCLFVACLLSAVVSFAQSEDWLPLTQEDMQYKQVPGNAGAPAVRLYFRHAIDDDSLSEFVYERIKILNEKGKQYADVEIPILSEFGIVISASNLKARTIHPDGSIVEFPGQPFEKTIYKGRGNKLAVKAFTMPEASVGSIIEYKYNYIAQYSWYSPFIIFSRDEWELQRDIHTVRERLSFRPYAGGGFKSSARANPLFYWDGAVISWVTPQGLKEKPKNKGLDVELELKDVPAFQAEEYMPPEANYKQIVKFFYSRRGTPSATEKAWQDLGKDRFERVETFLAKNRGVKETAMQAIGGEAEPGMRLRKLYERVQQIRNLSFERDRSREEEKKENIVRNDGVGDVLTHGYGDAEEITQLFVAMARAAGFDASIVQVSDRKRSFFDKEYITFLQLEDMIAAVNLNGQDLFLEPGTRFCPYGFVRWNHTVTEGMKLDKKGVAFVKAPPATYEKSVTRRTANVAIAEDGSLKGEVTVELKGYEALEHRLDAINKAEAGSKKDLEDEMKEWLPAGAVVKMTQAQGWEGADDPLVASFSIEVPSYSSAAGKRLLLPAYLFQIKKKDAFTHADRKYPVYFPYPFTEYDVVNTKIPAGFTVESVPEQQNASMGGTAKYINVSQFDGMQVVTERKLLFNGVFFPIEKYPELKTFFNKVQSGDEQQAILHGGNVSAQKGN